MSSEPGAGQWSDNEVEIPNQNYSQKAGRHDHLRLERPETGIIGTGTGSDFDHAWDRLAQSGLDPPTLGSSVPTMNRISEAYGNGPQFRGLP